MQKRSAGILLYRRTPAGLEVLLVHPGGPFWQRKDEGAWSIPKGEVAEGEDELERALREFEEETGTGLAPRELVQLGSIRQKGGKVVTAWAAEGDLDPASVTSNTFELEWPPRSGTMRSFPEIDRAQWFSPEQARRKILPAQAELVDRLLSLLGEAAKGPSH
jgi:predicted NUDIX family NTP pyrophosphohydrolase